MKVTAAVISWNSAAMIDVALRSLTAQTHPDLDIVVVDNDSADDSLARARGYEGVRIRANARNRGFAGGANDAVAEARRMGAEALVLCNPDVRLEPDYVARVVAALAADDARAAVQGKLRRLVPADGEAAPGGPALIDTTGHVAFRTRLFRNRGEGEPDDGRYDGPGEVFGVSGAVACYRLAALADVAVDDEVFDEDLFAYWEDVDLDWRLQLRGWRAWYEPGACGWHERGGAGPRRSATVERLNFVNRFFVIAKNDDPAALLRALPGVVATSVLKAGELAVTVPGAFVRALPALPTGLRRALHKRRAVQGQATVDPAGVVDRWFGPFDYGAWVRTWWRRVRRERARG